MCSTSPGPEAGAERVNMQVWPTAIARTAFEQPMWQ
jgi:hypothetical protein